MLERKNTLSAENRPHYCCTFIAVQKKLWGRYFKTIQTFFFFIKKIARAIMLNHSPLVELWTMMVVANIYKLLFFIIHTDV